MGVHPQTVTNYIDKGLLSWKKAPGGGGKMILNKDVERLAESLEEFNADERAIEELRTELRNEKRKLRAELKNTSEALGDLNIMFSGVYDIFQKALNFNSDVLCEREKQIAELIFKDKGQPYLCMRDVAEDFCLTRERVRQLSLRMMRRIAVAMEKKQNLAQQKDLEIAHLQEKLNAQNTVDRSVTDACTNGYKGEVFAMRLMDSNLSVRSRNCLKAAEIETVGDLVSLRREDLLKFRNLGRKSLQELTEFLEKLGLSFGMRTDEILNTLKYMNVPNRIYLHTGVSLPEDGSLTLDFSMMENVNWSDEMTSQSDIAYERVVNRKRR